MPRTKPASPPASRALRTHLCPKMARVDRLTTRIVFGPVPNPGDRHGIGVCHTLAASGITTTRRISYRRWRSANGQVLFDASTQTTPASAPKAVADNVTRRWADRRYHSGAGGHSLAGGRDSAGRRTQFGDTTANKDAWMVG